MSTKKHAAKKKNRKAKKKASKKRGSTMKKRKEVAKEPPLRVVEKIQDSTKREYHTSVLISEKGMFQNFILPLRDSSESHLQSLGPVGEALVKKTAAISGVTHIEIAGYCLTVKRSQAVEWEFIFPLLDKIFQECLVAA